MKEENIEIIGGGSIFKPGKKIIFEEDFNSYEVGDIPENLNTGETAVEVALFKGKKWLRFLSDGEVLYSIKTDKDFSKVGFENLRIKVKDVNPDEGKEFLITDIKIAEY